MLRKEFNELRKMAAITPNLVIESSSNQFTISLYGGGKLKDVKVISLTDDYMVAKGKVFKIKEKATSIKATK